MFVAAVAAAAAVDAVVGTIEKMGVGVGSWMGMGQGSSLLLLGGLPWHPPIYWLGHNWQGPG